MLQEDRDRLRVLAESEGCPVQLLEELAVNPESVKAVRRFLEWRREREEDRLFREHLPELLVRWQARRESLDESNRELDHIMDLLIKEEINAGN